MKKIYLVLFISFSLIAQAQVGIDTSTPAARLDISGFDTDNSGAIDSPLEGGLRLAYPGTDMTSNPAIQNQNILVQDAASGQVNHMKRSALSYMPIRASHVGLSGTAVIPITTEDYTILVRGDVTLPSGPEYTGKVLHLIYDSQENRSFTIYGPGTNGIKYRSYLTDALPINRYEAGYTLHYRGTYWVVTGGYEKENYEGYGGLITLFSGQATAADDHHVLVKGNINLHSASGNRGQVLVLAFNGNSGESFTVSGAMQDGTSAISTWTLNSTVGGRVVVLRSENVGGTWRWVKLEQR